MAARKMEIATVALVMVMTMLATKAMAQNNGCSSVMMTLSPCLDFIGSKTLEPGFSCCTTLGGIVQTDPRCLCMVLDGSAASFGITINRTRALELPGIRLVKLQPSQLHQQQHHLLVSHQRRPAKNLKMHLKEARNQTQRQAPGNQRMQQI